MNCPKCNGKMELDGQVGIWYCLDCEHQEEDKEEYHLPEYYKE